MVGGREGLRKHSGVMEVSVRNAGDLEVYI